jgi:hypothetical protein
MGEEAVSISLSARLSWTSKPASHTRAWAIYILCIAAALGSPAQTRPASKSDLAEWVGVYPFSEFFQPDIFYDYYIVIQDASGASLIIANGHMTCYRLKGPQNRQAPTR